MIFSKAKYTMEHKKEQAPAKADACVNVSTNPRGVILSAAKNLGDPFE
jgi:hypothetical protein